MGTTIVTMVVSSADSLFISLTSELVRPLDLFEFFCSRIRELQGLCFGEQVVDFIVRLRGMVKAVDGMGREC